MKTQARCPLLADVRYWHKANVSTGVGEERSEGLRREARVFRISCEKGTKTKRGFHRWVVTLHADPLRLGNAEYLDVPMSYQDIADHLGLTIETVSRTNTDMERSGMVTRVSSRRLLLQKRIALGHMMN
ncbi:MAG: helix-turn-helix domain-containing protein [Pseudolabrys sp.]